MSIALGRQVIIGEHASSVYGITTVAGPVKHLHGDEVQSQVDA